MSLNTETRPDKTFLASSSLFFDMLWEIMNKNDLDDIISKLHQENVQKCKTVFQIA